jgi:hypothetical protein
MVRIRLAPAKSPRLAGFCPLTAKNQLFARVCGPGRRRGGRAADTSWRAVAITIAAAAITLATRLSPMWMLLAGGALGGLSLL